MIMPNDYQVQSTIPSNRPMMLNINYGDYKSLWLKLKTSSWWWWAMELSAKLASSSGSIPYTQLYLKPFPD